MSDESPLGRLPGDAQRAMLDHMRAFIAELQAARDESSVSDMGVALLEQSDLATRAQLLADQAAALRRQAARFSGMADHCEQMVAIIRSLL